MHASLNSGYFQKYCIEIIKRGRRVYHSTIKQRKTLYILSLEPLQQEDLQVLETACLAIPTWAEFFYGSIGPLTRKGIKALDRLYQANLNTLLSKNSFRTCLAKCFALPCKLEAYLEWSWEVCSFFASDKTTTSHLLMPRDSLPSEDCQLFTFLGWEDQPLRTRVIRLSHVVNSSSVWSVHSAARQGCQTAAYRCLASSLPLLRNGAANKQAKPGHRHLSFLSQHTYTQVP